MPFILQRKFPLVFLRSLHDIWFYNVAMVQLHSSCSSSSSYHFRVELFRSLSFGVFSDLVPPPIAPYTTPPKYLKVGCLASVHRNRNSHRSIPRNVLTFQFSGLASCGERVYSMPTQILSNHEWFIQVPDLPNLSSTCLPVHICFECSHVYQRTSVSNVAIPYSQLDTLEDIIYLDTVCVSLLQLPMRPKREQNISCALARAVRLQTS